MSYDIDKIVSPEAIKQLVNLEKTAEKVVKNLDNVIKKAEALDATIRKINPKSLTELNKAAQEATKLGDKLKTNTQQLAAATNKLNKAQEKTAQEIKKTTTAKDKAATSTVKLDRLQSNYMRTLVALAKQKEKQNKLSKAEMVAMQSGIGSYKRLNVELNKNIQKWQMLSKAERENKAIGGQLLKTIQRQQKEIKKLDASIGRYQRNVGHYQLALKGLSGLMGAFGVAGGLMMFASVVKDSINVVNQFSTANSKLASVLLKTKQEIKPLSDNALELGASTRYTAAQVTLLQVELAKMGKTQDQILAMTGSILDFATATGAELPAAAKTAAVALNAFHYSADQTERVVSALAVGTARSALSFEDYDTILSTAGATAKKFGWEIEDLIAFTGKLKDAGFDASSAATATRNMLLYLADSGSKLNKEFGKQPKTFNEVMDALNKLEKSGLDLGQAFQLTDKRLVSAFANIAGNTEGVKKLREQVTGVSDDLKKMVAVMEDNMQGDLAKLKSAWEGLILSVEDGTGAFSKFSRGIVQGVTAALQKITEWLKQAGAEWDKLTEQSQLFRASIAAIKNISSLVFKALLLQIKQVWAGAKLLGGVFEDLINLDFDNMGKRWDAFTTEIKDSTLEFGKAAVDSFNEVRHAATKQAGEEIKHKHEVEKENAKILEQIKQRQEQEKKTMKLHAQMYEIEKRRIAKEKTLLEVQKAQLDYDQKTAQKKIDNLNVELSEKLALLAKFEIDRKAIIDKQAELEKQAAKAELDAKKITYAEYKAKIKAIDKKAAVERLNIETETENKVRDITVKTIQEAQKARAATTKTAADSLILDLKKQYAKGLISKQEYENKKAEIEFKAGQEQTRIAMEAIKSQIDALQDGTKEKADLMRQYTELKQKLDDQATEHEIENIEKARQKRLETTQEVLQFASQAGAAIFDIYKNNLEADLQQEQQAAQQKLDLIDQRMQRELEMAGDNEEQKKAIRERYGHIREEEEKKLQKKEAEIRRKQAIADRTQALFSIAINTAMGIVKTIGSVGFPAAIPLIAIVAGIGALQAAAVLSKPIPKFAKGTKNAPEGLAIVGEAGREIVEQSGKAMLVEKPTLTYLKAGAKVYNNKETEKIIQTAGKDDFIIKEAVVQNTHAIVEAIKNKKEIYFDTRNARITEREGSYFRTYYNKKVEI